MKPNKIQEEAILNLFAHNEDKNLLPIDEDFGEPVPYQAFKYDIIVKEDGVYIPESYKNNYKYEDYYPSKHYKKVFTIEELENKIKEINNL